MKRDFIEFLEILTLLFITTLIFAFFKAMPLAAISFLLFNFVAVAYPIFWVSCYIYNKIVKTKKD